MCCVTTVALKFSSKTAKIVRYKQIQMPVFVSVSCDFTSVNVLPNVSSLMFGAGLNTFMWIVLNVSWICTLKCLL